MMIFQASGNRNLVNHYMFFFFSYFDVQLLQDCCMFNLFHKRLSESRSDL